MTEEHNLCWHSTEHCFFKKLSDRKIAGGEEWLTSVEHLAHEQSSSESSSFVQERPTYTSREVH